ncbi:hypothetical protein [Marilutibacter chinensis]|uniref:Transmembrane protein n=1 Tax=Marilutibacter chinensis TaxID=2912247 RepID=A0ABS9HSR1_9GAMM|nr:hypothetical protein [Lysobacter chinensis]MCF7221385.1 hypothetical protein [Lysobacter chinensis]
MSPLVELNLALILFLPWFLILGALFWCFPRQPRTRARRLFDAAALLAALLAFLAGIHWAHAVADPGYGPMWRQVLATAVGYAIYLATMAAAFLLRRRWLRGAS